MMFHSRKTIFTIVICLYQRKAQSLYVHVLKSNLCTREWGQLGITILSLTIEYTFRLSLLGRNNWNIGLVFVEFFCCVVGLK
jgi:hypothetical protein